MPSQTRHTIFQAVMDAPEGSLAEGVTDSWKEAEGIFTLKEQNSKTVNLIRTISFLNVEGEILFAVLKNGWHISGQAMLILTLQFGRRSSWVLGLCRTHTSAITQLRKG